MIEWYKCGQAYRLAQLRRDAEARAKARPAAPPAAPVAQQQTIGIAVSSATQTDDMTRPANDHDELAVLRDIVKQLHAGAVSSKGDKAAWGRYYREAKRLHDLERQLMGRKQIEGAPPITRGQRRRRMGGQVRQERLATGL